MSLHTYFAVPLFTTLMLLTAGCARHSKGGGGVDGGGGGGFVYHSKEEVIKAVDEVWAEITKRTFNNPVLRAWEFAKDKPYPTREEVRAKAILDRIFSSGPPHFQVKSIIEDTKYFWGRQPKLEMDSLCAGPHDKKFLASVSKLDRSGEICISIYGLMRTPSGSLYHDLFGLFVHEAAHLNGFGEEDAQLVQKFFMKNIMRLLLLSGDDARQHFAREFAKEKTSYWPILLTYGPIDHMQVRRVSSFANILSEFQIPEHIARGAGNPVLRDLISSRKELLTDDMFSYAEDLYSDLKAGRTEVSERHLRHVRRLALGLIELDRQLNLYLFSRDLPLPEDLKKRPNELLQETDLVEQATYPTVLKDVEKRPTLFCNGSVRPDEDLSTEVRRMGFRHRFNRCALPDPNDSSSPQGEYPDPPPPAN